MTLIDFVIFESMSEKKHNSTFKNRLHEIVFEADTFWGKAFDVFLLIAILASIIIVMLESVEGIRSAHGDLLNVLEWTFTILFLIEYVIRLYIIQKPLKYAFSFFGIIDLLSILPMFLGLFIAGSQGFLVLRSIRLLRVFRVLKMVRFLGEASQLSQALKASRARISVFIGGVFIAVVILGSVMYIVEGGKNGFTSIPKSVYWAVVTLTTVGYGDIAPQTALGQFISTIVMILGYGIIAIPTGIVTSEMAKGTFKSTNSKSCTNCSAEGHEDDALFCRHCGNSI